MNNNKETYILGAVSGDIIGSVFEFDNIKSTRFPLFSKQSTFTDDSVLTIATMDVILNKLDYTKAYHSYARHYPGRGYGGNFNKWISSDNPVPYNSWGNGSAMRSSPIGWAYNNMDDVLHQAQKSAEVTHNHPEGVKGAQAVAATVFMARNKSSKADIRNYIADAFDYDLNRRLANIRPSYQFDVSCQGSVPEAIIAFLESSDFEDAIRLAISIGGDSDTIACMTGAIAEAFYKSVPGQITGQVISLLPKEMLDVIAAFSQKFHP